MELGIDSFTSDICYYLIGHSSGANLCALALLHAANRCEHITQKFIGFNGVYDIGKHFSFEKTRYYILCITHIFFCCTIKFHIFILLTD